MLIARMEMWHRPYGVMVNNKWYEVNTIKFYKDNEIIVSTTSGWLTDKDERDIVALELPIDEIKLRRKETFDGKVFIISQGEDWIGNQIVADLYIPADMLGIHFVEHKIENRNVVAVYEGKQGIHISVIVKSLADKLYQIRKEYVKVYNQLNILYMNRTNINIVFANIDRLKELAEECHTEAKKLCELTIEDIEI